VSSEKKNKEVKNFSLRISGS